MTTEQENDKPKTTASGTWTVQPVSTVIHWINVHDSLPKSGVTVLALTKNQVAFETTFNAETGWQNMRFKNSGEFDSVTFWTYFNLPR